VPCLALVTDRRQAQGRPLEEVVAAAIDGGVNLVQLREKDLTASELWTLAVRVRDVTAGRALLVVNDRLDVALAVQADGVHRAGPRRGGGAPAAGATDRRAVASVESLATARIIARRSRAW